MPVVPFASRNPTGPSMPQVPQAFLLMAAADLHEAGRLVEPSPSPIGPTIHPQDWKGNKEYKEIYEAGDAAMQKEKESGKPQGISLRPYSNKDPELNPKFAPDMTGKSRSGWNRVG